MKQETIEEVQKLFDMTVRELRTKYATVFNEQTRSHNGDYLRKKLAWRLQALDEGGLSARAKRRAKELANDADIRLRAPKSKILKNPDAPIETLNCNIKSNKLNLLPGTILKRVYKNKTLLVTVMEEGFLFDGQTYKSLSAIAKEVTGSLWNGRLFFGLTKRPKGKNGKQAK